MKQMGVTMFTERNQLETQIKFTVQSLLVQEGIELDEFGHIKTPRKFDFFGEEEIHKDHFLQNDLLIFKRVISSPVDDLETQNER